MSRALDLTGNKYGRLVVVSPGETCANGAAQWVCRCDCGKEKTFRANNLRSGRSTSCGCFRKEVVRALGIARRKSAADRHKTSPEHQAWLDMKNRCLNPRCKAWPDYGGRGIKVCERWIRDRRAFEVDMGPRPSRAHSIERRDNSRGYDPDNCYWADRTTQNNNTRRNRFIEHDGRRMTLAQWALTLGISREALGWRLRHWTVDRALSEALMASQS